MAFNEIMKGIYAQILLNELNKPNKKQRAYKTVHCCKCGVSGKTLLKFNNDYICKDCKEVAENANKY